LTQDISTPSYVQIVDGHWSVIFVGSPRATEPRGAQTRIPRSIWKGTVSFGMISVPVKLYAATESKDISA